MITIIPARIHHAHALIGRLRAGDVAEIEAAGLTQTEALVGSVESSVVALVALEDGVPEALWGVGADTVFSRVGRPWLLGTYAIDRNRRLFVAQSRRRLDELRLFPLMENWVDARYGRAIRWLRWLGFSMDEPAPWGLRGAPFRRFWMEA